MFKKIVCPIDFSPHADHALELAARMAAAHDAELVIVHVGGVPWLAPSRYPLPADLLERVTRDQQAGLASAADEATRTGAPRVSTHLLHGTPWHEITRIVDDDPEVDLVVIGTHGRSGIARLLLGSVAETVVRHAPCSVLAVRPAWPIKPFAHVLCPIDFSAASRDATEHAAELVAPDGTGITLLHAIELPVVYAESIPMDVSAEVEARTRKLMASSEADVRARVKGPISTLVEYGSPGARTLQVLDRDPSYDLVIVGSHGRTGLRRVVLGSVAEKIVRHAPCPVLVARPRRAPPSE